jgi:hypothetical protein
VVFYEFRLREQVTRRPAPSPAKKFILWPVLNDAGQRVEAALTGHVD